MLMTAVDDIVVVLLIAGIFGIGAHLSKSNDSESFFNANHALPWSLMVGTLMASWYNGAGTMGTVGYVCTMGFAAFFIWSIGSHAVRFPLALWIAPRISVKAKGTIPELLRSHYGKFASILGSIVLVITCLSIADVAAIGYIGEAGWNMNKFVAAAIVVAIAIGLTCLSGLMGVAITDMIFFALMIICLCAVYPKMFFEAGGLNGFHAALDTTAPHMMTALGGIPVPQAIVLVVLCINLYKDPAFYQRFAAAKTPQTGKRAMLTCFSIFMSFDLVMMMTGIIIGMKFPAEIAAHTVQPEVEYIRLVLQSLPVGLRGFFIVGLTGAIVSTLDSYYLVGGEIISNDIIYMLRGDKRLPDKTAIFVTRISAVIFGIIGLATAFRFARVYDAFLFLASISMTLLFVPMIAALMYDGKKTNVAGLASMIVGAVSWIWFTLKPIVVDTVTGPYTIDAVLIGLPLSFIAFLIGNRFGTDLTAKRREEALAKGIPLADLGLETVELSEEYKKSIRVEWLGWDGALILLYIVLACFYGYGILHNVDWIVGIAAPVIAMGIVIGVFVKYLTEVFAVVRAHKNKDVA